MNTIRSTITKIMVLVLAIMLSIGMMSTTAFALTIATAHPTEISVFGCTLAQFTQNLSQPYQNEDNKIGWGTGNVKWDPDTNTLTLDNVFCNEPGGTWIFITAPTGVTTTIKLIGTNQVLSYSGNSDKDGSAIGCIDGGNLIIESSEGATLKATAGDEYNAIFSEGELLIKSGTFDFNAGYPAIYTASNLTIKDSIIKANSKYDSGIFSRGNIIVNGNSDITANGYYSAINTVNDLIINDGKIKATSTNDMGIWSRGSIAINGGNLYSKGANGCAALGVRYEKQPDDDSTPEAKIIMNSNYAEINGGKISVSDWYEGTYEGGNSWKRSWTSFIAKDDENGLTTDRSNALNEVTISVKPEEYTSDVTAKYVASAPAEDCISVDVTWGSMEFTYTQGEKTWNPVNHRDDIAAGTWTAEGNEITLTNNSNVDITGELNYTADTAYSGVNGSFYTDTDCTIPFSVFDLLAANETAGATTDGAYFMIDNGTVDSAVGNGAKIGTITLTINNYNID